MKITLCLTLTLIILTIAGFSSMAFAKDKITAFIIDVRTVQEWNNGHIEGAILIPYDQIENKIGAIVKDKSQKIYLYCRTGRRSALARESLDKLGYKDVVNLGSIEKAAGTLKLKIVE
jgi:phage shock protein E